MPFRPASRGSILESRLGDVAGDTQRLQIRHVVRIAAGPERAHMIGLESARAPALPATPAVAVEDGPAHLGPAAGVNVGDVGCDSRRAHVAPRPAGRPVEVRLR